jgi:hypothetical protein
MGLSIALLAGMANGEKQRTDYGGTRALASAASGLF